MADQKDVTPVEPVKKCDRYKELRPSVRAFLEDLRDEDISELRDAMRFHRSARTVTKFGRWLVVTAIAVFIAATQLGEAMSKLVTLLFKGSGR